MTANVPTRYSSAPATIQLEPGFGHRSATPTIDATQATAEGGLNSSAPRRIPLSKHAVLYALDAQTGRELYSSGTQVTSFNHFSGLSIANGRVYLGTFDGMLYCFGL